MTMKKCSICEKEYKPKAKANKNNKYCSKICNHRAYRLRNSESFNARRRDKYKEDSTKIKAGNKRSYEKHKEVRKSKQKEYNSLNVEKISKTNYKYRQSHLEELAESKKKHREEFKDKWYSDLFCDRCGSYEDIIFHHVNPENKKYQISKMEWKSSIEILSEIAKCIVLCHSCHSKHHINIRWGNASCQI